MFSKILVCLIFVGNTLLINSLLAQHYSFRSYTLEDGLPQSEVWDIISDKRGYLWAGTNGGGLARFNGRQFQVFNKKHGLIDEQARNLFEDSKGNIWIATFNGLSVYDGRTFTNFTEKEGIIPCTFAQFVEDRQGSVWLYMVQNANSRRLLRFEKGRNTEEHSFSRKAIDVTKIYTDIFTQTNFPIGLWKDKEGDINVITVQKGILKLRNNKWEKPAWTKHDSLRSKNGLLPFLHDSQDRLWFTATPNFGNQNANLVELYCRKQDKLVKINLPNFAPNIITQILEDDQQNIWFSSFALGAICLKKDGSTIHFTKDNGLTTNFLNKIILDKEKNIWFGTRGSGIVRFDKGKFIAFTPEDGIGGAFVRSFLEDKNGLLWLGTIGGGIATYDGKQIKAMFAKDLTLGRIKCIDTTDTGTILMATDAGLAEVKGENYTIVNAQYALPTNAQTSYIYKATVRGEKLWFIGTYNQGFYTYNPRTKVGKNYGVGNSVVRHNYIHSILQDAAGKVWVCTNVGLICYEDENNITNYGKEHGLLKDLVIQVCSDKWGKLWVATYGEGLACFDGKKFVHTTPRNSNLASSVIYSVMLDNEGNLWAGTQKGVDKITFDSAGKIAKIKNYDRYDGFSGVECNGAANYKDRKGNLWFGTIKGAMRYNPAEDKPNVTAPTINITNIRLFFREVAWAGKEHKEFHAGLSEWFGLPQKLVLPAHKHHITFDFEAISFQSSEKVRYSWKLEGVDEEWTPETEKTEAIYPNLSAGTYTFWVKAMNSDGVWSAPISYQFRVLPPWYLTWWAITLFVLLVGGTIALVVRWRIEALKAYQRHLEKLVTEKTHEVTEQNAMLLQQKEEITIQAENLHEANVEITKRQQEITDSINYAKRIQDAILPQVSQIQALLPDSFVLFRPRDIVSGDFYWFAEVEPFRNQTFKLQTTPDRQDFEIVADLTKPKGKVVVAAADCTGHGVPGAFMSMIGNELLHEVVTEKGISSPEQILHFLHVRIRQALRQGESTNRDGMDISICLIDRDRQVLEYAGARGRMLYFQQGAMHELKGDKFPIGGEQREIERVFTLHSVSLVTKKVIETVGGAGVEIDEIPLPTTLYMFSDGYIDQFGGKDRKKFRISQLREILQTHQEKSMQAQQQILENALDKWIEEGNEAQIDDVMVIGIRL
jgi:ligand-binding sensor domain-containing protein